MPPTARDDHGTRIDVGVDRSGLAGAVRNRDRREPDADGRHAERRTGATYGGNGWIRRDGRERRNPRFARNEGLRGLIWRLEEQNVGCDRDRARRRR